MINVVRVDTRQQAAWLYIYTRYLQYVYYADVCGAARRGATNSFPTQGSFYSWLLCIVH